MLAAAARPVRVEGRLFPDPVGVDEVGVLKCGLEDCCAAALEIASQRLNRRNELAVVYAGSSQSSPQRCVHPAAGLPQPLYPHSFKTWGGVCCTVSGNIGRRSPCQHHGPSVPSSSESPGPMAHTPRPTPPVWVRTDPTRPSAPGIPSHTVLSFSASWIHPPRKRIRCPLNRVKSRTAAATPLSNWTTVVLE